MPNNFNKKNKITLELRFLIACCQAEPKECDIEFINKQLQNINQKNIIQIASKHGVLPLLYKSIQNLPSTLYSLPSLITELKAHYQSITKKNILMSAELIAIMKLLKENGIEALGFKGPLLSKIAYGDITLRQYGDIDILIRKKNRSKMMDLLLEKDYIPEINLKEETKDTFFNSVNVVGLYKKSTRVLIEIHWELLSKNYAIDWDEESLWSSQTGTTINQINIPMLSIEQHLLYLCSHGSKHLFERLEWICDIDRIIMSNKNINWELILREAEKLGIKRMLYLGLSLSKEFFNTGLTEKIEKEIIKDKEIPELISKIIEINFSKNIAEGQSYKSFILLWNMRENLSNKLHYIWFASFAAQYDDFKYIQLKSHLSFLYSIIRPFRLITKYFNKNQSNI